ncbi:hypothetical protein E3N88_13775 [Mikania micrantha]|uniref:Uncharacterized protein n=1 Tax=Mikania micrantha TaxID=192012 RepID=A0A5N6P2L1_9ASTR|nr:hypothetical protein E3N88_13775 [Mikania micrantha]
MPKQGDPKATGRGHTKPQPAATMLELSCLHGKSQLCAWMCGLHGTVHDTFSVSSLTATSLSRHHHQAAAGPHQKPHKATPGCSRPPQNTKALANNNTASKRMIIVDFRPVTTKTTARIDKEERRERWISGGQKAWLCKRMNCFLKYEVNCKIDLTNCKEGTAVEGDGGGGRRRWDEGGGGAVVVVPAVEQLAGGVELEMGCGRRDVEGVCGGRRRSSLVF